MTSLAQTIAETTAACKNCHEHDNQVWAERWQAYLDELERELPRGAGIDNGTKIDYDKTDYQTVVLNSSYHIMDGGGSYAGWIDFTVTVLPTFSGDLDVIVDLDQRDIDRINQAYDCEEVPEDEDDAFMDDGDRWSVDADGLAEDLGETYRQALAVTAPERNREGD